MSEAASDSPELENSEVQKRLMQKVRDNVPAIPDDRDVVGKDIEISSPEYPVEPRGPLGVRSVVYTYTRYVNSEAPTYVMGLTLADAGRTNMSIKFTDALTPSSRDLYLMVNDHGEAGIDESLVTMVLDGIEAGQPKPVD